MKFVYNLQPTGDRKAKIQSIINDTTALCPCCRQCTETQLHMMQCHENPGRAKAIAEFTKTCKKSDSNRFNLVLGDFIVQWLRNPNDVPSLASRVNPFLRYELYPDEYIGLIQRAILEQTEIGWMNTLRGFLSTAWHTLASSYFDDSKANSIINKNDGDRRVRQAIRAIYNLTQALWLGRNEALHKNTDEMDSIRRSGIDLEISRYHKEANLMLHEDRFYCDQPLRKILQGSQSNKRRWLHRVKLSRARQAHQDTIHPRLTQFFPVKRSRTKQDHTHTRPNRRPMRICTPHVTTTQELMTTAYSERSPNPPVNAPRTTTIQQLLTKFLRERAPNSTTSSSPSPSRPAIP